ncbi:MAG: hypothetical protein Q9181_006594 [Wetmoreana brouardii]
MSQAPGNQHQGVFIEEGKLYRPSAILTSPGSGGFMSDLTFNGWTFKSIFINKCCIGLNITNISPSAQTVGSATFIDSDISDTPIGVLTSHAPNATSTNSILVLENVKLRNVRTAIQGAGNTTLLFSTATGGSRSIDAWAQGHIYTPKGPSSIAGPISAYSRPGSLLEGGKFYERSKPQYADIPASRFMSARTAGAKGDGVADDTQALQDLFIQAASTSRIVFIDAGTYRITRTLNIPKESKIVGEAYPVIMSSDGFFANMQNPQPVVQVGQRGEEGCVELSDFIISTQGVQAGAVGVEWNIASKGTPSGMWDVHVRIGGFAGSQLQLAECPAVPDTASPPASVEESCIGAHTSMHVNTGAEGLYMEKVWLWTADHDLDDPVFTNITVYSGQV